MNKKAILALIAQLKAAKPDITDEEIKAEIVKKAKEKELAEKELDTLADSIEKSLDGEGDEEDESGDEGDGEEDETSGTKSFKGIRGSSKKLLKSEKVMKRRVEMKNCL